MRHWLPTLIRMNWAEMRADAGAFWSMMSLMAIQNILYFMLWVILFDRVGTLRGWGLSDVAMLFGAGAFGYGIFFTLLGGLDRLAETVADGRLDLYLARPRAVLPMVLMSRTRSDSLGDLVTGLVMMALFVRPEWSQIPMLLLLTVSMGLVFASARLVLHTLAFWGMAGQANENAYMAFLIAGTNPQHGIGTLGKYLLLTVFPAGYLGLVPVLAWREQSGLLLLGQVAASLAIAGFSVWLFHRGLARYASGNQFVSLR